MSNRVLIRRKHVKEEIVGETGVAGMTAGGLYIPAVTKLPSERPQEGEVLASGPGRFVNGEWQENDVKVGDYAIFGRFAGSETEMDGETFLVMREDEVLGVKEGEEIIPIKSNMLGRILVKPYIEDPKDSVIINVNEELPENSDRGVVVSVGKTVKLDLQKGDDILFVRHKPRMYNYNGEMYLFLTEDLVNAKIIRKWQEEKKQT